MTTARLEARMDSLFSFPVGLFHPLQHAGLARRTPSRASFDNYTEFAFCIENSWTKECMLQEPAGQRNCEVNLSKLTPCVQSRHSGIVLAKRRSRKMLLVRQRLF